MKALSRLLEKRAKYFATSFSAGDSAEKAMKLGLEGLRQRMKGWIAEFENLDRGPQL